MNRPNSLTNNDIQPNKKMSKLNPLTAATRATEKPLTVSNDPDSVRKIAEERCKSLQCLAKPFAGLAMKWAQLLWALGDSIPRVKGGRGDMTETSPRAAWKSLSACVQDLRRWSNDEQGRNVWSLSQWRSITATGFHALAYAKQIEQNGVTKEGLTQEQVGKLALRAASGGDSTAEVDAAVVKAVAKAAEVLESAKKPGKESVTASEALAKGVTAAIETWDGEAETDRMNYRRISFYAAGDLDLTAKDEQGFHFPDQFGVELSDNAARPELDTDTYGDGCLRVDIVREKADKSEKGGRVSVYIGYVNPDTGEADGCAFRLDETFELSAKQTITAADRRRMDAENRAITVAKRGEKKAEIGGAAFDTAAKLVELERLKKDEMVAWLDSRKLDHKKRDTAEALRARCKKGGYLVQK